MELYSYKKAVHTSLFSFKAFCLLLVASFTAFAPAKAFVSNYTFASSTGTYTPITGTVWQTGAAWDDVTTSVTLPFTFTYDNLNYTTLYISSNGFVSFNTIASVYNVCGLQASPMNTIAAYGTDLEGAIASSTIQYTTVGTTPNRQFVVQWTNVDHYNAAARPNRLNFQLRLSETTNVIQLIWGVATMTNTWGDNTCSDAITESGSVGLMGNTTTDLNIRKITNGNDTWAASIAGATILDVCNLSPSNVPASGLTYTWTPEVQVAMSYSSGTTAFINDMAQVGQGTNNNPILQVQVVTAGSLTPFNVTSLHLSTTGCTNAAGDIVSAKVYYTGYTNVFSTGTQFGSTVASPNGAYTVNGTAVLNESTNYFWIVYDISPTATLGDTLKGCCTLAIGSGVMGSQVPSVTCPAGIQTIAQIGAWTTVNAQAPDNNAGVMLLLSDGTVMCKTDAGGSDGYGNSWDLLTPNAQGSYANGTWSRLAPMFDTRLYFSGQVMTDGRVYIAGGEYGTGTPNSEVYDPLTNAWTQCPSTAHSYVDANSEMLPDGRVLQACEWDDYTFLYDPLTNTYSPGPITLGTVDESIWVKLPDQSILFVDMGTSNSERYIPATNTWIVDATVPVDLYDPYGDETGAGFLLPDGRVFFLGDLGFTAYYTPSGNTSPGSWTTGPMIPDGQGPPDAASAMMVNGKILCATSPIPTSADHFPTPTSFYEFNYLTNTFTHIKTPQGDDSQTGVSSYITNMLDLPDGNVLFSEQGDKQYYLYQPGGPPVAAGKPTVASIVQTGCNTFRVTGTLFNGIGEGAAYGDDWQTSTNRPIVRLSSGSNVWYARDYNWNRTDVATGNLADTTYFTLPVSLSDTSLYLEIVANGIASDTVPFNWSICLGIHETASLAENISVYPNPAGNNVTVAFTSKKQAAYNFSLVDVMGKTVLSEDAHAAAGNNKHQLSLEGIAAGIYVLEVRTAGGVDKVKLVVE